MKKLNILTVALFFTGAVNAQNWTLDKAHSKLGFGVTHLLVSEVEGKKYKMVGDLTLHGVTKTVRLDVTFNGTAVHPYNKKTIAGFKVSGSIKRSDFGVGGGTPTAVVSDEVAITANTEFVKG